ncbi:MAG: D-aminoacyl-tRNA deacylase [Wenyingzhuangia sp.]
MRVVIQRVSQASVTIGEQKVAEITKGLLILVGIVSEDTNEDVEWLCQKIVKLRIFDDQMGMMNLSLQDIKGELLVVSQFTLHALTKKGNRPSYVKAANSEIAIPMYNNFKNRLASLLLREIQSGEFGANMKVALVNDGPITITIDSHHKE